MRQSVKQQVTGRFWRVCGLLVTATVALAGCSSAGDSDQASDPAQSSATADGSETAEGASSGAASSDAGQASDAAQATGPAPASTAPPPAAYYPPDPAQDPVVDLGPPPAAYQAPRPECPTEAKACVDLTNSMTWLQEGGTVTYGPIQQIAGRDGYRTTPGMHQVIWKNIDHVSSEFGEPMPYAIFFTTTGMAFHQGPLTTPSHGCVHLPPDIAALYWQNLEVGDLVYIFGEAQY